MCLALGTKPVAAEEARFRFLRYHLKIGDRTRHERSGWKTRSLARAAADIAGELMVPTLVTIPVARL